MENDTSDTTTILQSYSYIVLCPKGLELITFESFADSFDLVKKNLVVEKDRDQCQEFFYEFDYLYPSLAPSKEKQNEIKDRVNSQYEKKRQKYYRKLEGRKKKQDKDLRHTNKEKKRDGEEEEEVELPLSLLPLHPHFTVGTCKQQDDDTNNNGDEISIGYYGENDEIVSHPGVMEGISLLHLKTNMPPSYILSPNYFRGLGCGPILSLISCTPYGSSDSDNLCLDFQDSLDEASSKLKKMFYNDSNISDKQKDNQYETQFNDAMEVWAQSAWNTWPLYNTKIKKENESNNLDHFFRKLIGETPLSFRASSVRSHSKRYVNYNRDDLLPSIASLVPDEKLNGYSFLSSSPITKNTKSNSGGWKVDLTNYDFELVCLIIENGLCVLGLSLLPYQKLNARSFSKGRIPADIIPPYITGTKQFMLEKNNDNITTLRPNTAKLMIHLAQLKKGDVMLDPCAGLGTIPVESLLTSKGVVCLGGEIELTKTLNHTRGKDEEKEGQQIYSLVRHYIEQTNEIFHQNNNIHNNFDDQLGDENVKNTVSSGMTDMLGWDACLMPIKTGCIDAIISDLPFGQRCMSSNKLKMFLPLLMNECARVLTPKTGRMVLLVGGTFQSVLEAIRSVKTMNGNPAFEFPLKSMIPTNISGFAAWILVVQRSSYDFLISREDYEKHLEKVRKLTHIRTAIELSNLNNEKNNVDGNQKRKKRMQTGF